MGGNGQPATKQKDQRNDPCNNTAGSNPIELSQQSETLALTLFQLPGEMGLSYSLYYTSPRGWYDSLGYWLDFCVAGGGSVNTNVVGVPGGPHPPPPACTNTVRLHRPDGAELVFTGTSGTVGNYPVQGGSTAALTGNADGTYTLHDEDGTTQVYSSTGALLSIKDTSGIGWTLATSGNNTTTVTATDGASFTVARQATTLNGKPASQVTVTDPAGNAYVYFTATPHPMTVGHDTFELLGLTLPGSPSTTMTWKYATDPTGVQYLLTEEDYNGAPYFYISYDSQGHATGSSEANGNRAFSIVYTQGVGTLTAAVTNPLGFTTTKQFGTQSNGEYMLTSVSAGAMADCGATTRSYAYDANGHLTQSVDNDGVTHTYSYNANGQLQTETEAAGTAAARTIDYVWDPNQ